MSGRPAAAVVGLGAYAPERVLSNADLEKMLDTNDEWIVSRTGIRERRIAAPGETASTLGAIAARRALEDAQLQPADIDLVICATNTGDTLFPCTAGRIWLRLEAPPRPGFDVQAGCTGWVYALELGRSLIAAGSMRRVLVVGTDVLSSIVDWEDRSTAVLFGDGAGAVVLEARAEGSARGVLASYLNCDGQGGPLLMLPAGGSAMPANQETIVRRQHFMKMAGNDVFRFAVRALPEAMTNAVAAAGLTMDDVDLVVPHQANARIIEAAARRLNMDWDRFVVNIERYGNTSVASIPLALVEARDGGRLPPDGIVLLAAFGAGLTWGAVVIRWGR